MKKLLSVLLSLAVCTAALCLTAAAAEAEASAELPVFTQAWGKVSPWDGEGILLKNDNPDDPLKEVVIHV